MDLHLDSWAVDEKYIGREREGIFILLETAGFPVFHTLRAYISDSGYISWYGKHGPFHICGLHKTDIDKGIMGDGATLIDHIITKQQLKEFLVNLIKFHEE